MIFEKLSITRHTTEDDGFGGKSATTTSTFSIFGKVNITDNELKSLPSGYGFYKKIIIATFDELLPDDQVIYDSLTFRIVSGSSSKRFNIYYGVQNA